MSTTGVLEEVEWRGLVYQRTDGVPALLAGDRISAYIGFDPTGSSLHVGSLLVIMLLVHLQRHGHRPVALVGGGTGMIGDPSGKTAERQLLTPELVAANTASIRAQLEHFLDFSGPAGARMRDNAEWLSTLNLVEFLRDTGKHFTVNYMLQKESVRSRMDAGLSFTEFSYMLLKAYDFLELHRRDAVARQLGDDALLMLRSEAPFHEVTLDALASDGDASTFDVLKLLTASELAASNGAAKRLLEQGAVSINKQKLGAADRHLPSAGTLLSGQHIVVGNGKRDFALLRVRA